MKGNVFDDKISNKVLASRRFQRVKEVLRSLTTTDNAIIPLEKQREITGKEQVSQETVILDNKPDGQREKPKVIIDGNVREQKGQDGKTRQWRIWRLCEAFWRRRDRLYISNHQRLATHDLNSHGRVYFELWGIWRASRVEACEGREMLDEMIRHPRGRWESRVYDSGSLRRRFKKDWP